MKKLLKIKTKSLSDALIPSKIECEHASFRIYTWSAHCLQDFCQKGWSGPLDELFLQIHGRACPNASSAFSGLDDELVQDLSSWSARRSRAYLQKTDRSHLRPKSCLGCLGTTGQQHRLLCACQPFIALILSIVCEKHLLQLTSAMAMLVRRS